MFFSVIKDIYSARPVVVGFKAGKGYGVMWDVDAVGIYVCRRRGAIRRNDYGYEVHSRFFMLRVVVRY